MLQALLMRIGCIVIAAALAMVAPPTVRTQSADEIDTLNRQVDELYDQGKYAEATPLAEQALLLAETSLGRDHTDTIIHVLNLAEVYKAQARFGEAEPLYRRVLEVRERELGNEHADTLKSVNTLALLYYARGRYSEAEQLHRRALEARERVLGRDHPSTLASVNNLALLYKAQGRRDEAEPLYQRALEANERVLGREHPSTITGVNNLGALYAVEGRYGEAEPLYQRALEACERVLGKEHPDTLMSINNLAMLDYLQGRYGKSEPLLQRAVEASVRVMGQNHPQTLSTVNNLAEVYRAQGRYREAEPLYRRTLEASERVLGKEHPDTLFSVSNLALLYYGQGRYGETEPLFLRALEVRERVLGKEHPDTLTSVNNLALLYHIQDRYGDAGPLYQRALEASERVLGKEHPDTLRNVNNLALFYDNDGRHGEAELLYQRALEASERGLGKEHPSTLFSISNLAMLYYDQGRHGEAEPLLQRVLEARERLLGKEHPDTLDSVNNLAVVYNAQGRIGEAEPLYRRALEARARILGNEHPHTLISINNLAVFYAEQGDWTRAAAFWKVGTAGLAKRSLRGAQDTGETLVGKKKSDAEQLDWQFSALVKVMSRLAPQGAGADAQASREMFQTAQWALGSETAQSLTQMAARGTNGDPELATLVRERQDVVAEWQKRDALRNAWLGRALAARGTKAEAENAARLAAIDARVAAIDNRLAASFPNYAALVSPEPLSVEAVRARLGADEALVLFLETSEAKPMPEESFIWVVTRTDLRWARSDLGKAALAREVQALRCGLDAEAWRGPRCAELTGQHYTMADKMAGRQLPFDLARAHGLYKALFGQVEDLIKGKHLLIVPSGALTQLPFQVLVTAPPESGSYRSAAWLARDHGLTVLPAVSSLEALRRTGHSSAAAKPLIGFGNPLLDGPNGRYANLAQRARDNQTCHTQMSERIAAPTEARSGTAPIESRGGLANLSQIRRQAPLPETADELCAVARDIGADIGEIRLGAHATEHEVKAMSEAGKLAQYRIVHFATHGAMAGELKGSSDPGLILTPPDTATEDDDGYLSASEITALKLDADWVILSACNTAAGNTANAEALSGLARAFIYAQARALLVSHWAVDSNATVKLVTSAMLEIARDRRVGRGEALRRAMLALIDKGDPHEAHPSYWAPFVVVGEGAH